MITDSRKRIADSLLPSIHLQADDVTRIRGWMCFLAAITILYHNLSLAALLVFFALILDSMDGAVARKQGVDCPQTDRAMDIFTGFVLCTVYLWSYPSWIAISLISLFILPKTLLVVQYLNQRLFPSHNVHNGTELRSVVSFLVLLQSFPVVHVLLVLVLLQWVIQIL